VLCGEIGADSDRSYERMSMSKTIAVATATTTPSAAATHEYRTTHRGDLPGRSIHMITMTAATGSRLATTPTSTELRAPPLARCL
jgi:hypothetical protein